MSSLAAEMINFSESKCSLGAENAERVTPSLHFIPFKDAAIPVLRCHCSSQKGQSEANKQDPETSHLTSGKRLPMFFISNYLMSGCRYLVDVEMAHMSSWELHGTTQPFI